MSDQPPTTDPDDEDDGARTGICHDGPLAGQELTSRYPLGVLLVDRPARKVWIYDWCGDGFRSRTGDTGRALVEDENATDNRWRAAEEGDYDVLAAPWAGGDPDTVDAYEGDDLEDGGN